jgi:hypothetical protein
VPRITSPFEAFILDDLQRGRPSVIQAGGLLVGLLVARHAADSGWTIFLVDKESGESFCRRSRRLLVLEIRSQRANIGCFKTGSLRLLCRQHYAYLFQWQQLVTILKRGDGCLLDIGDSCLPQWWSAMKCVKAGYISPPTVRGNP